MSNKPASAGNAVLLRLPPRQKSLAQRTRNRDLRERIAEAEKRTDLATAKLTLAEARIIELTIENRRLEALLPNPNITQLKRR